VIGGLICATFATLLFVPVVFAIIHGRKAARRAPDPHASGQAADAAPDAGEAYA
jgi:hypothetical protein